MSAIVIDTNVLLVANGEAPQTSAACKLACINRLEQAAREEIVVLDQSRLIVAEYGHKLDPNRRQPGPGDGFLRYLLVNMTKPQCVSLVPLTPHADGFAEFPGDGSLQRRFDPSDRKFIATANAHADRPSIIQATDSKWLNWEAELNALGIHLECPCRAELEAIHQKKMGSGGVL